MPALRSRRSTRRALAARGLAVALLCVAPSAGCTGDEAAGDFLEDADPMALAWVTPERGEALEVDAPVDLVVSTAHPGARAVRFEVDGREVGSCDPSAPEADCHEEDLWRWTVTFATPGRHTVAAAFTTPEGQTVRAAAELDVATDVPEEPLEEGAEDEPDPLADEDLVEEGDSQVVQAISRERGFLDPNRPLHNVCGGTRWRVQAQRVLLERGRIDGSTRQVARCVERYGASVRRYADAHLVSRGNAYAALAAAGNCDEGHAWRRNPVTGAQCAALNPALRPAECAARMRASNDFAVETLARYLASRPVRARHRNDPPRVAAVLGSGGGVRCSRRNHWRVRAAGNYVDRFVAAYNAYRTSEGGARTAVYAPAGGEQVPALEFAVRPRAVLARSFVGYGAQYNQNLFAAYNRERYPGATDAALGALRPQLAALQPRHVRVFFSSRAFAQPDLMESFRRTVRLAQDTGATVNVTYWHGPYRDPDGQMARFADVLAQLRTEGITAAQYVTIQNEVNSTRVTCELYERLYRTLDRELRARGLRETTRFVGGDLLRDGQREWFRCLGARLADLMDGYSVHIYWDMRQPGRLVTRLVEVRKIVDDLPAAQRRPLYVTEYGARGDRSRGVNPGVDLSGRPVSENAEVAFQHAWFNVLAASLGYVGLVKWDAYIAAYDNQPQDFSLLGPPGGGWERRPAFYVTRLFSHVAPPGWEIVRTDGGSDSARVASFRGPGGEWSVIAMNRSAGGRAFRVRGLPPGRPFQLFVWSRAAPRAIGRNALRADTDGAALFRVPPHGVVAITTADPGL